MSTPKLDRSLLNRVVVCAIDASRAIRACSRQNPSTRYKADQTPVTRADQAAHERVLQGLKQIHPKAKVLSEEGVIPPYAIRRLWKDYWLVDPLDGTKEYLAGREGYTVNIALIRNNHPVLGVIVAPATQDVYYAAEGMGAWRRKESSQNSIRIKSPKSTAKKRQAMRVLVSRSHLGASMEQIQKQHPQVSWLSVGSSIKFAWVAEGRADCYLRLTPTMEWDVAAGDCILSEVKRSAGDCSGPSPLRYNKRSLKNPLFLVGRKMNGECFASAAKGMARFEQLLRRHDSSQNGKKTK